MLGFNSHEWPIEIILLFNRYFVWCELKNYLFNIDYTRINDQTLKICLPIKGPNFTSKCALALSIFEITLNDGKYSTSDKVWV